MIRPLILGTLLAILITAILIAGLVWVALATWHPARHARPSGILMACIRLLPAETEDGPLQTPQGGCGAARRGP